MNPESSNRLASSGPARNKLVGGTPRAKLVSALMDDASGWEWRRQTVGKPQTENSGRRNVLIVGAGPLGREMAAILKRQPVYGRNVVGFLDKAFLGKPDEAVALAHDVLGGLEELTRVARTEFVDEVILAIPGERAAARRLVREARLNRLDIRMIPDLFDCERDHEEAPESGSLKLENFGGLPVLRLHQERRATAAPLCKRALDITLSALALLAAAPLLLAIAFAIKLTSTGRALYPAERVGLKGRRFICYKFRTMVANAEGLKNNLRKHNQRQGPCFKIADDPRVTSLGRLLRRYSLDELPQFWNVLRGDMSLVGPRPHPIDDFEQYRLEHLRRLDVTPGITGLWQVTARRDPSFQRNMALDLEYIEHWTFGLDLRILLKTIFVILHGSGA